MLLRLRGSLLHEALGVGCGVLREAEGAIDDAINALLVRIDALLGASELTRYLVRRIEVAERTEEVAVQLRQPQQHPWFGAGFGAASPSRHVSELSHRRSSWCSNRSGSLRLGASCDQLEIEPSTTRELSMLSGCRSGGAHRRRTRGLWRALCDWAERLVRGGASTRRRWSRYS